MADVSSSIARTAVAGREFQLHPGPVCCALKVTSCPPRAARSTAVSDEFDAFKLFITDEMLHQITEMTNLYGRNAFGKQQNKQARHTDWQDTDVVELRAFIGLLIIAGALHSKKESCQSLWDSAEDVARPVFRATMPRNRFQQLLVSLRFDDLASRLARRKTDKLAALRQVFDSFCQNCCKHYQTAGELTIDEQLVTFRGKVPFKVYMPRKPGKYGMKIWTVCDARTSYMLHQIVYVGKASPNVANGEKNSASKVVLDLLKPVRELDASPLIVTTDNYFTSLSLAEKLLLDNVHLVGTVNARRHDNRNSLPACLLSDFPSQNTLTLHAETRGVALVAWQARAHQVVLLCSAAHQLQRSDLNDDASAHKVQKAQKPVIVQYYNSNKGGVDTLDKLVREYSCRRKTLRWPFALFMNCLDIAAYNAFVLLTKCSPTTSSLATRVSRKSYLLTLGRSLVRPLITRRAAAMLTKRCGVQNGVLEAVRMTLGSSQLQAVLQQLQSHADEHSQQLGDIPTGVAAGTAKRKRVRCCLCRLTGNKVRKVSSTCSKCSQFVCSDHYEKVLVCAYCDGDADLFPRHRKNRLPLATAFGKS